MYRQNAIYDAIEEILEEETCYTPLEFMEQYSHLVLWKETLENRMRNRSETNHSYLFFTLLSSLEINIDLDETIQIPTSKAYVMVNILQYIFGSLDYEKKYIFVDEFQDFSSNELTTISRLYPNAIFNLYGDPLQCLNKKGINIQPNSKTFIGKKWITYSIEENYRNAKEITKYANQTIGISMNPIGLSGTVSYAASIPVLDISEDDRVAIIYSDELEIKNLVGSRIVNYYTQSHAINRGIMNAIPIRYAKGLEFEKVILIKQKMTKNELYVAALVSYLSP